MQKKLGRWEWGMEAEGYILVSFIFLGNKVRTGHPDSYTQESIYLPTGSHFWLQELSSPFDTKSNVRDGNIQ